MKHAHTDDASLHHNTATHWAFAAKAFAWIVDWFGRPAELADMAVVNARFVWDIGPWLSHLESLVRRLLVADAARLRLRIVKRGARDDAVTRTCAPRKPETGDPATWRAPFRVPMRRPNAAAPKTRLPPPRFGKRAQAFRPMLSAPKTIPTLPFARRIEALGRVIADPRPAARRLARRFALWARSNGPPLRARLKMAAPRVGSRCPHRDDFSGHLRRAHRAMTRAVDSS